MSNNCRRVRFEGKSYGRGLHLRVLIFPISAIDGSYPILCHVHSTGITVTLYELFYTFTAWVNIDRTWAIVEGHPSIVIYGEADGW